MRGGRAIKVRLEVRLRQSIRFVLMVRRFTEWSRRELSDIDGQAGGRAKRERASQTPYNLDRRMLLQQFGDLHGIQGRAFEQLIA